MKINCVFTLNLIFALLLFFRIDGNAASIDEKDFCKSNMGRADAIELDLELKDKKVTFIFSQPLRSYNFTEVRRQYDRYLYRREYIQVALFESTGLKQTRHGLEDLGAPLSFLFMNSQYEIGELDTDHRLYQFELKSIALSNLRACAVKNNYNYRGPFEAYWSIKYFGEFSADVSCVHPRFRGSPYCNLPYTEGATDRIYANATVSGVSTPSGAAIRKLFSKFGKISSR